jgi:hypothetical protein
VFGLRRDYQNRKITVALDFLQAFHYLESIHAKHTEIEQDQTVTPAAVEIAYVQWIGGGFHGSVAGDPKDATCGHCPPYRQR